MWRRAIISAVILFSVFLVPWWLPLVFACAAAFYFPYFVELILVGALIDAFYGSAVVGAQFPYVYTLGTALAYAAISMLKKRLIMY